MDKKDFPQIFEEMREKFIRYPYDRERHINHVFLLKMHELLRWNENYLILDYTSFIAFYFIVFSYYDKRIKIVVVPDGTTVPDWFQYNFANEPLSYVKTNLVQLEDLLLHMVKNSGQLDDGRIYLSLKQRYLLLYIFESYLMGRERVIIGTNLDLRKFYDLTFLWLESQDAKRPAGIPRRLLPVDELKNEWKLLPKPELDKTHNDLIQLLESSLKSKHKRTGCSTVQLMKIVYPNITSINLPYSDILAAKKAVQERGGISTTVYSTLLKFLILVQLNVPYHFEDKDSASFKLQPKSVNITPLFHTIFEMHQTVKFIESDNEVFLDFDSPIRETILSLLNQTLVIDDKGDVTVYVLNQVIMDEDFDAYTNIYVISCGKLKLKPTLFNFLNMLSKANKEISALSDEQEGVLDLIAKNRKEGDR